MSANSPRFLSPLRCERLDPRLKDRVLLAPLMFESVLLDRIITVPEGFVTDFASVPRAPFTYWLFGGVADEAAVVRDFLYEKGIVPREQADSIYGEAITACGVADWCRNAMVAAVRMFGASRYLQVR